MAAEKTAAKKSRITKGTRTAMFAILFVVVILVIVLLVVGTKLNSKIVNNDNRKAVLEQQIEDEELRQQQISELDEYMKSDEYLEQVAKEKLGMVRDGEIIFKETQ